MKDYNRDQVLQVISSVMDKVCANQLQPMEHIHSELEGLASTIDQMHADILATRSHDVGDKHIPNATDELDAVIGATEDASATIMDACDAIQDVIDPLPENVKTAIAAQTTKIFEACAFQDITGQRITKVISTLRQIEMSVDNLLQLFGPVDKAAVPAVEDTRSEDQKLMEGPQLSGRGVSQDDIDKLLAEFD